MFFEMLVFTGLAYKSVFVSHVFRVHVMLRVCFDLETVRTEPDAVVQKLA